MRLRIVEDGHAYAEVICTRFYFTHMSTVCKMNRITNGTVQWGRCAITFISFIAAWLQSRPDPPMRRRPYLRCLDLLECGRPLAWSRNLCTLAGEPTNKNGIT